MIGVVVMVMMMVVMTGKADDYEGVPSLPYNLDRDAILKGVKEALEGQLGRFVVKVDSVKEEVRQLTRLQEYMGENVTRVQVTLEATTGELKDTLATVKAEVEELKEVKAEVASLVSTVAQMKSQLARVATNDGLTSLKAKLVTMISTGLQGLATKVEALSGQVAQVTQKINVVRQECGRCGQTGSVAQLLNLATSSQHSITTLSQQLDNATHTLATYNCQGCATVGQRVEEVARERCGATTTLAVSVGNLQTALDNIQSRLTEVVHYTRPPPSPPTPAPTPAGSGERTPCLDSTFLDGRPQFDVCAAAIKFKKCQVNIVAYHCCRTCTNSGHISADGPWRFYNYPRRVMRSQALQFMRTP